MANNIEKLNGTVSRLTNIRFEDKELAFLARLEAFQRPGVKRRGVGPALHRLIEHARGWDEVLAAPLRAYLVSEGMSVERFAELAGLEANTVHDILTLATRQPDHKTVAKIRGIIG